MPRARWDPTHRYIELRLASHDAVEPPSASLIAARLLETAGDRRRLPVLLRVDQALPAGMRWRLDWMDFVIRNRRELRIAVVRDGYSTGALDRWGDLTGVDIQEFGSEREAVDWLTKA